MHNPHNLGAAAVGAVVGGVASFVSGQGIGSIATSALAGAAAGFTFNGAGLAAILGKTGTGALVGAFNAGLECNGGRSLVAGALSGAIGSLTGSGVASGAKSLSYSNGTAALSNVAAQVGTMLLPVVFREA